MGMTYNVFYVDGPTYTLMGSYTTLAAAVAYVESQLNDVAYKIVAV